MIPHKEFFCEYEIYDGGNFFLGDDSPTKIIGQGKFNLKPKVGIIRTLPSVIHIQGLEFFFIFIIKMSDGYVKVVFEEDTFKMVQGNILLLKEVWIEILYKPLGKHNQ